MNQRLSLNNLLTVGRVVRAAGMITWELMELDANVATTHADAFGFCCASTRVILGLDFEHSVAPAMAFFFFLAGCGGRTGGFFPNINMIELSSRLYLY